MKEPPVDTKVRCEGVVLRFATFESDRNGPCCVAVLLAGVEKAITFSLSGDMHARQMGEWDIAFCQPGDRISLVLEPYPNNSWPPLCVEFVNHTLLALKAENAKR